MQVIILFLSCPIILNVYYIYTRCSRNEWYTKLILIT